jgi:predicted nucleic acid-binding protein
VAGEFFVDTSAWYPLLVAKHPDHAGLALALRGLIRNHRRLVTTNLYTDQDFSFTDAVSFAVMTERRIRDALSLDHRFVVAGFQSVGVG